MRVRMREAGKAVWTWRMLAATLLMVSACALARPVLAAQQQPDKPTAAQDQYVPVNQPMNASDNLPAPKMLAAAYAFVWVALLVYLWSIRRRLATVEKEIATVSRRVAQGNPRA